MSHSYKLCWIVLSMATKAVFHCKICINQVGYQYTLMIEQSNWCMVVGFCVVQDGSGSFVLPKESASSAVDLQPGSVAAGEKETLESIVESAEEDEGGDEGEEESEGGEEEQGEEVEEEGDEGEGEEKEYDTGPPTQGDEEGSPWQDVHRPYHIDIIIVIQCCQSVNYLLNE